MIAEKNKVYKDFPTPLINRLEKHFVLTSSVLEEWQEEVLEEFEAWIASFCDTRYLLCNNEWFCSIRLFTKISMPVITIHM